MNFPLSSGGAFPGFNPSHSLPPLLSTNSPLPSNSSASPEVYPSQSSSPLPSTNSPLPQANGDTFQG
jgi:hypothetical protein